MQTKCVTYTSFNADYLAVPNNSLTHTSRADLLTSINIRTHMRTKIYGFSCFRAREAALFFIPIAIIFYLPILDTKT